MNWTKNMKEKMPQINLNKPPKVTNVNPWKNWKPALPKHITNSKVVQDISGNPKRVIDQMTEHAGQVSDLVTNKVSEVGSNLLSTFSNAVSGITQPKEASVSSQSAGKRIYKRKNTRKQNKTRKHNTQKGKGKKGKTHKRGHKSRK